MNEQAQAAEIKRLQGVIKQLRAELKPHRMFYEFMRMYNNTHTRDKTLEYLSDSMLYYEQDTQDLINPPTE